jgi:hypothetical protein
MRTAPASTLAARRSARAGAATLALALVLAACGLPAQDTAPPTPAPAPGPPDVAPPAGPDAPVEVPEVVPTLAVFLVRTAPTTFYVEPTDINVTAVFDEVPSLAGRGPESREIAALDPLTRIELALRALLVTTDQLADGLRVEGVDPELASSVPAGTTLLGVTLEAGLVTVDLGGAMAAPGTSGGSAQEVTFAEQLAHTVMVEPSVTGVRLKVAGVLVDELWGHLDWSVPLSADPFALSPVTIESPTHGAVIDSDGAAAAGGVEVEIRGQATVFEATLLVRALGASGEVLTEGFLTASMGAPERGTWVWMVLLPGPGIYRIEAYEDDPSDGEGRPPYRVTRTFELR